MESRSVVHVAPNGAKVEVGVIVHEGQEFVALGSIISPAEGLLVGYVTSDGKRLQTFNGETICDVQHVSYYCRRTKWHLVEMHCYRARYNGVAYHGRGSGPSMLLRMRSKAWRLAT